jgi:hypothetical protein
MVEWSSTQIENPDGSRVAIRLCLNRGMARRDPYHTRKPIGVSVTRFGVEPLSQRAWKVLTDTVHRGLKELPGRWAPIESWLRQGQELT